MCIRIPTRVVQVGDMIALVDFGNGEPTPALINANEEVREGDYVIVS
jgi:hydrogenase maturation factor